MGLSFLDPLPFTSPKMLFSHSLDTVEGATETTTRCAVKCVPPYKSCLSAKPVESQNWSSASHCGDLLLLLAQHLLPILHNLISDLGKEASDRLCGLLARCSGFRKRLSALLGGLALHLPTNNMSERETKDKERNAGRRENLRHKEKKAPYDLAPQETTDLLNSLDRVVSEALEVDVVRELLHNHLIREPVKDLPQHLSRIISAEAERREGKGKEGRKEGDGRCDMMWNEEEEEEGGGGGQGKEGRSTEHSGDSTMIQSLAYDWWRGLQSSHQQPM